MAIGVYGDADRLSDSGASLPEPIRFHRQRIRLRDWSDVYLMHSDRRLMDAADFLLLFKIPGLEKESVRGSGRSASEFSPMACSFCIATGKAIRPSTPDSAFILFLIFELVRYAVLIIMVFPAFRLPNIYDPYRSRPASDEEENYDVSEEGVQFEIYEDDDPLDERK